MREAVIVSTARTPIGRAYRGAFNDTQAQALAGHALGAAVARVPGLDGAEIEDVVFGCALQQGSQGFNIGRQAALRAGLPLDVPGMTVDRQCGSGLMAIGAAAKQIIVDGINVAAAGGVESISLVQNAKFSVHRAFDPWLQEHVPALYMAMLETAEIVADRFGISREDQDAYALQSQQRTAQAQAEGRFDAEIVPLDSQMLVTDKATGETSHKAVRLTRDEGNRPETSAESLAALQPVFQGGQRLQSGRFVTAGNASQLSDGASAMVLMEAAEAARRGLT
ncbi:MAG TPA: acetyl-CoA C-acyltransferase, partial [Novosphingobium sp.]